MDSIRTCLPLRILAVFLLLSVGVKVSALPTGGVVAAGSANISSAAKGSTITQTSQSAVINWDSFNIAGTETVRFLQPSSSSVILNRVLGSDPSSILGNLTANGIVFLVNPNGVLFGRGASVNVGGLVAATLNISDSDFMAGSYRFNNAGSGSIVNQGLIRSDGAYVALLGASVSNEGVILARLGTVALVAGKAITLDLAGDGLLNVTVNQSTLNALAENGGLIQADGGHVLLSTQAVGSVLAGAVNNTGVIQAQTIENHSGTIRLLASMQTGTVNVSGAMDASAPSAGGGGFVETSAAHIKIADSTRVSTLAAQGKAGSWLVDPTDFTVAASDGDISGATLAHNLLASNVTISSGDGHQGTLGDIHIDTPVHWAGATTLTLNAVHDVIVRSPITADTAGASFAATAGNDFSANAAIATVAAGSTVRISAANDVHVAAITGTAANTLIDLSAGHDLFTSAALTAVAADSAIKISAVRDISIAGQIVGTAANTRLKLEAGRDVTIGAPITAIAANSLIQAIAGRDITTTGTAAVLAVAAATAIDLTAGRNLYVNSAIAAGAADSPVSLNAGHDVNVSAAIAAGAAGSSIRLIAGLDGSGPGVAGGTVNTGAAVASPNVVIRFNPNSYVNTAREIASYGARVAGILDAKAWAFVQAKDRVYDGTTGTVLTLAADPSVSARVMLVPGTAAFDSRAAGANKTISFTGYSIAGQDANQFALFSSSGTTAATIAPRPLTITALDKVYDGSTASTLTDNRMAGDVFKLSSDTSNFSDRNAGDNKAVSATGMTLSGIDAANYSLGNSVVTRANIRPAALTITASNVTNTYGQTAILSAFTAAGLVNSESVGSISGTSVGAAASTSVVGSPYVIVPSKATGGSFLSSNYVITYVNGLLAVNPANLTVMAANATKIFGQTTTLNAFTAAGLMNGETIAGFTETSAGAAAGASVAGSPYPIKLSVASGGSFTASNYAIVYVDGALTVTPQLQPGSVAAVSAMQANSQSLTSVMAGILTTKLEKRPAQLLQLRSDETAAEVPAMLPLESEP